jgi:hypothetical protein
MNYSNVCIKTKLTSILRENLIIGNRDFIFVHTSLDGDLQLVESTSKGSKYHFKLNETEEGILNTFMEEMRLKYVI